MSADRYSICPHCQTEVYADKERKVAKAQKSYGKVSAEEYIEKVREAEAIPSLTQTLREDYNFYLEDGTLEIDYSCRCGRCNKSFKFKQSVEVKME